MAAKRPPPVSKRLREVQEQQGLAEHQRLLALARVHAEFESAQSCPRCGSGAVIVQWVSENEYIGIGCTYCGLKWRPGEEIEREQRDTRPSHPFRTAQWVGEWVSPAPDDEPEAVSA